MKIKSTFSVIFGLGLLAIVPALSANSPIVLSLTVLGFIFAIVASNWNLLFGFAGVWSFGQLVFFGIGAYTVALLTTSGESPWIAMILGVGISVVISISISVAALRLKAVYFALATLGLQEVVRGILVTTSPQIIYDIPPLAVGGLRFDASGGIPYYYTFMLLFVLSLFTQRRVLNSKTGLFLRALRDGEQRATSLGVPPLRTRTIFFIISVVFTSLAGSLYAIYLTSVDQSLFGFDLVLTYILILALGGIGTFYGPTVAAFIWVYLDFILRLYIPDFRLFLMGGLVIISLLFLKDGITGLNRRSLGSLFRQLSKQSS